MVFREGLRSTRRVAPRDESWRSRRISVSSICPCQDVLERAMVKCCTSRTRLARRHSCAASWACAIRDFAGESSDFRMRLRAEVTQVVTDMHPVIAT
jgi:hypothetical protein